MYGCRCYGIEITPERVEEAKERIAKSDKGVAPLVNIIQGDALEAAVPEPYTCAYLYLTAHGLKMLWPRLQRDANASNGPIRVVTALYKHPDLKPESRVNSEVSEYVRIPLYSYTIRPQPPQSQEESKET